MSHVPRAVSVVVLFIAFGAAGVSAQQQRPVELGAHVASLRLDDFDTTDAGIGVQAAWRVTLLLAVDGAPTVFPGSGRARFSRIGDQQRLLGVIGVRTGVTFGRTELFARVRPGFLTFADDGPVPCIRIFPPPLSCEVLGGYTALVTELGGGVRVGVGNSRRLQIALDAGDLLVRYGFPSFRDGGLRDSFVSHNLLASAGLTWRF